MSVLSGCGPSVDTSEESHGGSESQSGGDGTSTTPDDEDDASSTSVELVSCDPSYAEGRWQGVIRSTNAGFLVEFGGGRTSKEPFTCDTEEPCRSGHGDAVHRVIRLFTEAGSVPRSGVYSADAGDLDSTERFCGCCNGEGGGPDDWDNTTTYDEAQLIVEGGDTTCVHGRLLDYENSAFPTEPEAGRTFVAFWCG